MARTFAWLCTRPGVKWPMEDIMAGVDHVIAGGKIDPSRLAVTGGSYGGYMTAWIVGHSDRFCAAVAQRGVLQPGQLLRRHGHSTFPQ